MALCPFGQHRLILNDALACKRCGNDLSLYAELRDQAILIYNLGRDHWDKGELEEAKICLMITMKLRPDIPEVYWLMAGIFASQGRNREAKAHLVQAQKLGADVDPNWILDANEVISSNPVETRQFIDIEQKEQISQESEPANPTP